MWYRNQLYRAGGLRKCSQITYKASNILLGQEGEGRLSPKILEKAQSELALLYNQVEAYIARFPAFHSTFEPWSFPATGNVVGNMIAAGNRAGVGPMAAVAGAFADGILNAVGANAGDLFVENGGDVALQCLRERSVLIYPGSVEFEAQVAIQLPPGRWGIASSSGKWGHSHSLGQADMVTVAADDAATADALATAIANRIVPGCDPEHIISTEFPRHHVAVFWEGRFWYRGDLQVRFV